MEPIVLTEFGETLVLAQHFLGNNKFCLPQFKKVLIGFHEADDQDVYAKIVSATHYVVYCEECGRMGSPIPLEIDTSAKLRQWCEFDIQHPGLSEEVKKRIFLAAQCAKVSPPTSAEIVKAADKERERIRKIIGR